jgi:hypothetical protein
LSAVALLVVAAMVWQETTSPPERHPVGVIEEAALFVWERLGDGPLSPLDGDEVLRILEWELFYPQGLDPRSSTRSPAVRKAIGFIGGASEPPGASSSIALPWRSG